MAKKRGEAPFGFVQPPKGISPRALEVWRETVTAYASDYFNPSHRQLLYAYCEACAAAEKIRKLSVKELAKRTHDAAAIKDLLSAATIQEGLALRIARGLRITLQSQRPPPLSPGKGRRRSPTLEPDEGNDEWPSLFDSGGKPRH